MKLFCFLVSYWKSRLMWSLISIYWVPTLLFLRTLKSYDPLILRNGLEYLSSNRTQLSSLAIVGLWLKGQPYSKGLSARFLRKRKSDSQSPALAELREVTFLPNEGHQNVPRVLTLIHILPGEGNAGSNASIWLLGFVMAVAELEKKCPSPPRAHGQPPPLPCTTLIQKQVVAPSPFEALGLWSLNLNELSTASAQPAFDNLLFVFCFFLHLTTYPGHFSTTTVTDLLFPVAVSLFFGCVGSVLLRAGFSLVAVSGGYSLLRCVGFSLRWLLL